MYKYVAYLAAFQDLDPQSGTQDVSEIESPFLDFWLLGDSEAGIVDVARIILLSSWGGVRQANEIGVFSPSYLLFPDLLKKERSTYLIRAKENMAVFGDGQLVGSLYDPDLSPLPCLFPFHTHGIVVGTQALYSPSDNPPGLAKMVFDIYDLVAFCLDCNRYKSAGAIKVLREGEPKPVGVVARYDSKPFSQLIPPRLVDQKMAYLHKIVAGYEGQKKTDKLSLEFAIWASEQFRQRLPKLADLIGKTICFEEMAISLEEV